MFGTQKILRLQDTLLSELERRIKTYLTAYSRRPAPIQATSTIGSLVHTHRITPGRNLARSRHFSHMPPMHSIIAGRLPLVRAADTARERVITRQLSVYSGVLYAGPAMTGVAVSPVCYGTTERTYHACASSHIPTVDAEQHIAQVHELLAAVLTHISDIRTSHHGTGSNARSQWHRCTLRSPAAYVPGSRVATVSHNTVLCTSGNEGLRYRCYHSLQH